MRLPVVLPLAGTSPSAGEAGQKPLDFCFDPAPGSQRDEENGPTSGARMSVDPCQQNHYVKPSRGLFNRFCKGEGVKYLVL